MISCSSFEKKPLKELVYSKDFALKLQPGSLGLSDFQEHQLLTMIWGEKKFTSTTVLQSKDGELNLIALNPVGTSLFEAYYKDGGLSYTTSQMLPKSFKLDYVMLDILLVYVGRKPLIEMIKGSVLVKDTPVNRSIFIGSKKLISIIYKPSRNNAKEIFFKNLDRKYSFRIKVMKAGSDE